LTHDLWSELSEQVYAFLSGISLGQLVDQGLTRKATSDDVAAVAVSISAGNRAVDPV
jgi:hypothetical protein